MAIEKGDLYVIKHGGSFHMFFVHLPESRQIDQCTWDMPISEKIHQTSKHIQTHQPRQSPNSSLAGETSSTEKLVILFTLR